VCPYVGDDLRERKMIDLGWLEDDIYVVIFYDFGSDGRVDLKVIFVQICEGFDVTEKIKFNK